jgi:hypothetical protein
LRFVVAHLEIEKKKKKKRTQRDGMKTVGAFIYSIEIWGQFLA